MHISSVMQTDDLKLLQATSYVELKNLSAKITTYVPNKRFVTRKPNLKFIRVIKNVSFDQSFLYI